MSKRSLASVNLPYSTNDGGKWLKKILDPADIDVEVVGMPDTQTNPRAVLNYQMQSEVPIPEQDTYLPSVTSSYDADVYVFQNPITFACTMSYPQGTKNPIDYPIEFNFNNPQITLAMGTCPRTCNIILNEQIEGKTRSDKMLSLRKYCQRHRLIYAGVQAIPACSALFDSGTIEATQQVFSPETVNINDAKMFKKRQDTTGTYADSDDKAVYKCQRFYENDFPDAGNSIQNPAALYCRYKEGLYMPYKLRNPLVHEYRTTEDKALIAAPYVLTPQAWAFAIDKTIVQAAWEAAQTGETPLTSAEKFTVFENLIKSSDSDARLMALDYNAESRTYTINNASNYFVWEYYIQCVSKTGMRFYLRINHVTEPTLKTYQLPSIMQIYFSSSSPAEYTVVPPLLENPNLPDTGAIRSDPNFSNGNDEYFEIPYNDTNIGVVSFKSIGMQASVRLLFRLGLEMMITAGGVYSPFKHKAPKYDEKAINTYIKACHNMRDAFLGDAATPEGHADYASHISEIVMSSPSSIGNQGSSWYGRVSVI